MKTAIFGFLVLLCFACETDVEPLDASVGFDASTSDAATPDCDPGAHIDNRCSFVEVDPDHWVREFPWHEDGCGRYRFVDSITKGLSPRDEVRWESNRTTTLCNRCSWPQVARFIDRCPSPGSLDWNADEPPYRSTTSPRGGAMLPIILVQDGSGRRDVESCPYIYLTPGSSHGLTEIPLEPGECAEFAYRGGIDFAGVELRVDEGPQPHPVDYTPYLNAVAYWPRLTAPKSEPVYDLDTLDGTALCYQVGYGEQWLLTSVESLDHAVVQELGALGLPDGFLQHLTDYTARRRQ